MKLIRLLTFMLAFILLCPLFVYADGDTISDPIINAQNAFVVHLNTGIVAYEKGADEKIFPGCTTKVMTAILAMEKGSLDTQVEAKASAFEGISSLSSSKIQKGEILTVRNLLNCLIVGTSNEAANILAEYVSGSIPAFVEEMNKKAKELGTQNTNFTNAQGIYDGASYTTARDSAKIIGYAISLDGFMDIANTTVYTIPATNLNSSDRYIYSNNQLIISTSAFYSSFAKGIKTASTAEGGGSLATVGEKKIGSSVEKVLIIAMGCQKTDTNTALNNAFIDCKTMLNWFYQNHKVKTLVEKNEPAKEVKVELSGDKDFTLLLAEDSLSTLVPATYSADKLEKEYIVPASVMAPVEKGQIIGTMVLKYDGVEYGRVNLVSQSGITRNAMMYYSYQLNLFFKNIWVRIISILIGTIFILYIIYTVFYNKKNGRRRRVKRRIKF